MMKKFLSGFFILILVLTSVVQGSAKPTAARSGTANLTINQSGTRPNIVFILLDDLDATTSPFWDVMTQTKTLLRDRGIVFNNAFAPTPICCPARSTILTGKYGHNTGVLTNAGQFGGWETFVRNGNEERTFAVSLQNAGYKTALMGKYLNGIEADPTHIPPGWTEWYGFTDNSSYYGYNYSINENGTIVSYGNSDADYNTDVLRGKAVDFINRAEQTDAQPFFLYLSPTAPHLPLPPARRHRINPYSFSRSPRTPNYNEPDISDKSPWLRLTGNARAAYVNGYNDIDYRNRMGSLYAVDEMIADIYQTLQTRGELDNTIFVFTSDNGYNLGAHRLLNKMVPYEESIRVPLVISGAGIAPREESRMTLETDFAPTFLELAGLPIPNDTTTPNFMDGQSLVPLLNNEQPAGWRNDAVLQYRTNGLSEGIAAELPPGFAIYGIKVDVPTFKALRTQTHLYLEWYNDAEATDFQAAELYDLREDPYQLENLLGSPLGRVRYQTTANSLNARMSELITCKGDACR